MTGSSLNVALATALQEYLEGVLRRPLADRRVRFAQLFVESNAFARGTAHRIWTEFHATITPHEPPADGADEPPQRSA